MVQNPLHQFYRQPKIFISLPSKGIYNKVGAISGDPTHLPVYGMTGMDDIMMKTPDALLSGDSTVKLIESCCSSIKDGWNVSALDIDLLLIAIRIATHGNSLEVVKSCPKCGTENDYDLDLGAAVDHFNSCVYNNTIVIGPLTITLQPLTYRQTTDFSLRNFRMQQQLAAAPREPAEDYKKLIDEMFLKLGEMQNEVYALSIHSIDTGTVVVTEPHFIADWLANCDTEVFNVIKKQLDEIKTLWKIPAVKAICSNSDCNHKIDVSVDLDHSNFFDPA